MYIHWMAHVPVMVSLITIPGESLSTPKSTAKQEYVPKMVNMFELK